MAKVKLTPEQKKQQEKWEKRHSRYNQIYLVLFAVYQILVIVLNGVFVRPQSYTVSSGVDYALFTTVGSLLLVLIGFGLYFSYLRNYNWSGIGYTFFINALVFQFYYLVNGFWLRTKLNDNSSSFKDTIINAYLSNETFFSSSTDPYDATLVGATKCGLALSIAFAAIAGRAGYLEAFIIAVVGTFGYQLNTRLVSRFALDIGGSMTVFLYGGVMGTILALLLAYKQGSDIIAHPEYTSSKLSRVLSLIGALFCWVFFPALNMDISPQLFLQTNAGLSTIICISASVTTMVGLCLTIDQKIQIRNLITAPIAGGVIIGSSSIFIYNPLGALMMGSLAAILQFIFNKIEVYLGLQPRWSNGVCFLFAVQGFIGGLASAVHRAIDKTSGSFGALYNALTGRLNPDQVGQIQGTFISLGIGALSGLVIYILVRIVSKEKRGTFYQDAGYWTTDEHHLQDMWTEQSQKVMQLCSESQKAVKNDDFF